MGHKNAVTDIDSLVNDQTKRCCLQEIPRSTSSALRLLMTCIKDEQPRRRRMEDNSTIPSGPSSDKKISTADIMKIARAKLPQYKSQNSDLLSSIITAFDSHSGLSSEDNDDIQLALLLQASAERVALQQFERAQRYLMMCNCWASQTGNPVQRVAYYFAEALKEKIGRETGTIPPLTDGERENKMDAEELIHSHIQAIITIQEKLPFTRIIQYTGMQSILDNVASASRIHLIDLGIKSGSHWTVIMQSLSLRNKFPVQFLKITAVGKSTKRLEATGKRLSSFAQSMKLPFEFSFVAVKSDMKELKKDMLDINSGEAVAVYSEFRLWSLLARPSELDSFLGLIKSLNPCIMVVVEGELCTNQVPFLDRFNATLDSTGALFDCIHSCLGQDEQTRVIAEGIYLGSMIQNLIVADEEDRVHRSERIDFWRNLFSSNGMVETELSYLSMYQASLILKMSANWIHCNVEMNEKCMIIGWKGVPIQSLSAWKFQEVDEATST
ncbi:hypothetical protein Leryth_017317 [Lithospermum erythrorhizon]|uniref:Uncharacterized protein n=1 Tax=Lithospermum erythrorhizon TaxID=34254 RepID=A0AAV3QI20_LITER|nr:hypothetical protein Leryth_017317 [Lithospermum erythrorhizon]